MRLSGNPVSQLFMKQIQSLWLWTEVNIYPTIHFFFPNLERRKMQMVDVCRIIMTFQPSCFADSESDFITTCKRSLRRLCFYTCLSIHRGSTWAGASRAGTPLGTCQQVHHPLAGTPPRAGTPPGRYIPQAGTPPGQVHPLGRYTPRHPWAGTPLGNACWDMVNKWAVSILLECILVWNFFHWVRRWPFTFAFVQCE